MTKKRPYSWLRPQAHAKTKLARARLDRTILTQEDMVERTGISRASYVRLEAGLHDNPPLRWLTNCAYVLGLPVEELIEDEWRDWVALKPGQERPNVDLLVNVKPRG